jgi:predicted MFS family arabinose efflux permease
MVRAVCAVLFVAACARLLSVITVGTPHTLALVLMTIEFIYPCVMVPWQTAVARRVGTEPT